MMLTYTQNALIDSYLYVYSFIYIYLFILYKYYIPWEGDSR